MSVFNFLRNYAKAMNDCPLKDPGASGTIEVRQSGMLHLRSAAAEARTLPRPGGKGTLLWIDMETDGGDITLTVTGGYNEDGDTTFVFSDPGQFMLLISTYQSAANTYQWRKFSDHATGNLNLTSLAMLDAITATAAEINNVTDASARNSTLTAAGLVLTAADTGKVFFINNATGFVAATLPAVAGSAGVEFTFINKTPNTSGNHTIVTSGSENVINGNQNSVAGDAGDTGTTDDTISFVANQSVAGDKVYLISDGVKWFAYAISRVAAGMTFTTAS